MYAVMSTASTWARRAGVGPPRPAEARPLPRAPASRVRTRTCASGRLDRGAGAGAGLVRLGEAAGAREAAVAVSVVVDGVGEEGGAHAAGVGVAVEGEVGVGGPRRLLKEDATVLRAAGREGARKNSRGAREIGIGSVVATIFDGGATCRAAGLCAF